MHMILQFLTCHISAAVIKSAIPEMPNSTFEVGSLIELVKPRLIFLHAIQCKGSFFQKVSCFIKQINS